MDRAELSRSEAEAAALLAEAMHRQGNTEAAVERRPAGLLVSLGSGRYVNRLLCTEPTLGEDDVAFTIDFFSSRSMDSSVQISRKAIAQSRRRLVSFLTSSVVLRTLSLDRSTCLHESMVSRQHAAHFKSSSALAGSVEPRQSLNFANAAYSRCSFVPVSKPPLPTNWSLLRPRLFPTACRCAIWNERD